MGFTNFVSEERALEKCSVCDKVAILTKYSFIDLSIKSHRNKVKISLHRP